MEVVVRVYLEVDPTDPTDLAGSLLLVGSVGSVSLNPNYLVVREVVRGLVQVQAFFFLFKLGVKLLVVLR